MFLAERHYNLTDTAIGTYFSGTRSSVTMSFLLLPAGSVGTIIMTVVVGFLVDLVGPMILGFVVWALLTLGAGLMLSSSLLALPVWPVFALFSLTLGS
jgi:hypothetical protein